MLVIPGGKACLKKPLSLELVLPLALRVAYPVFFPFPATLLAFWASWEMIRAQSLLVHLPTGKQTACGDRFRLYSFYFLLIPLLSTETAICFRDSSRLSGMSPSFVARSIAA